MNGKSAAIFSSLAVHTCAGISTHCLKLAIKCIKKPQNIRPTSLTISAEIAVAFIYILFQN
jgi:hypothetical protein